VRVATIVRASKSLLDLCRNSEQPFLGAICPTLIVLNIRPEFPYPVVSGSKLIRKLPSDVSRLLEVFPSRVSRPVNHVQNDLPGTVQ
jgi:hypothetical protein